MIKIENLNIYYDKIKVLSKINLEIENKDYLVITGENGSGKSTFIKSLLGLNKNIEGKILIDNTDIRKYTNWEIFGYVAQKNVIAHDVPITVYEYLSLYYNNKKLLDKKIKEFKVSELLNKKLSDLSGGQFQKINIIKSLSKNIKYLILDEPENSLDAKAKEEIYEIIENLNKNGLTIIIISHNLKNIKGMTKIFNVDTNIVRSLI